MSDFETACKSNSKLSKLKSVVNDNYATLLQKSVIFHRERRDYLRHALGQFLHLATDRPFILEYKAPVVECLLAMAKEEVMWYLAHCEPLFASRMPKQHQSRIQSATGGAVDQRITELLYLAFHVRQLVVSQKRLISSSYSRLLKTHYGPLLSVSVARIISATRKLDEPIAALLNTIVKQIEDCRPIGDSSTTTAVDMGVFRMNYLRLLVYCHSTFNTITDESGQEDLLALMNEIQIRSRYATEPSIQQTFEQGQGCCGCNFSQLYYCRPILQQMYESVVRQQPEQMRFISVYAKLAAQDFSLNASSYFPVEASDTYFFNT